MKLYLLLLTLAFIQFVQGGRVRMPDEVKPAQVKEIQERKGIADDEDVAKEADKVPELKTKLRKLRKADFHGGNHATSFPPVSFSSSNQFHSSPPLPSGVYTKPFSSNSGPNSFYTQPTPPRPVSTISNQVSGSSGPTSLIDFSQAVPDPETGSLCVIKNSVLPSERKDPILECKFKNVNVCHFTYVTQYIPNQEEICDDNFEKICQITFTKRAFNETVKKCYREVEKICDDNRNNKYGAPPPSNSYSFQDNSINSIGNNNEEICKTFFETICSTRYRPKYPGAEPIADTSCEKIPRKLCGNPNCRIVEKPQQCHEKQVASIVDVPEESCDLNPQKTCRLQTKLSPKLTPIEECSPQPKEVCQLKFDVPKKITKPLKIKWCLDTQSGGITPSRPSYGAPLPPPITPSYGNSIPSIPPPIHPRFPTFAESSKPSRPLVKNRKDGYGTPRSSIIKTYTKPGYSP